MHNDGNIMKLSKFILLLSSLLAHMQSNGSQPLTDVLLIINYNHPHYSTIPFFKEIYGPYFPNIIFTGSQPHPEIEYCEHREGFYCYKSLVQIVQKYPNFAGYLFVHDDCVINPWNFARFNKSKIWSCAPQGPAKLAPDGIKNWNWWDMPIGYQAIKNVYDKLNAQHKTILIKNCGENAVMWGYADIVYLPSRFNKDIIELCSLMAQEQSFLEIAIPTLCSCLDEKTNWEYFNGINLSGDRQSTKDKYAKNIDFLHSVKLSSPDLQHFIRTHFKEQAQAAPVQAPQKVTQSQEETPDSCNAKSKMFVADPKNSLHKQCVSSCANVGQAKSGAFGTNNYFISLDQKQCLFPCDPGQKPISQNGKNCVYPCDPAKDINWNESWKCMFSPTPIETPETCAAKSKFYMSDMNNTLYGQCVPSCLNIGLSNMGVFRTNNYFISFNGKSCVSYCNPGEIISYNGYVENVPGYLEWQCMPVQHAISKIIPQAK